MLISGRYLSKKKLEKYKSGEALTYRKLGDWLIAILTQSYLKVVGKISSSLRFFSSSPTSSSSSCSHSG